MKHKRSRVLIAACITLISVSIATSTAASAEAPVTKAAPEKSTDARKARLEQCLKDYLEQLELEWDVKARKNSEASQEKIKVRCLTKSFRASWKSIVKKTDTDPLLLAQDFQDSWKSSVHAVALEPTSVMMVIGASNEEHCVVLGLDSKGESARISSSKHCPEKKEAPGGGHDK